MVKVLPGPNAIDRRVLADHVHEALLASLMDGRLEPGAAISIDGTARDLEVSPTPVREALARLEHTGMVRRVALKGYRVAPVFSREEMAQLMEARLAIEPVSSRLVTTRTTAALLRQLERAVESMKAAPRGPSFREFRDYLEADELFHRLIAEGTGNPFLLSAYNSLGGQVQRFRLFTGVGITDADSAIAEHTAVLLALKSGNPAAAEEAMRNHVLQVGIRAQAEAAAEALAKA